MSCIAGNRLLAPPLPRSKPPPPPIASTSPLSLGSFTSTHLLRLRLRLRNSARILSTSSTVSASLRTLVFSRFGGFIDDDEEEEEEEEEEEQFDLSDDEYDEDGGASSSVRKEIDLSMIKGQSVRLIDQNQKMVGIVSKIVAKQKAEDAGLNLRLPFQLLNLSGQMGFILLNASYDAANTGTRHRERKENNRRKLAVKQPSRSLKWGRTLAFLVGLSSPHTFLPFSQYSNCKIEIHDYNVRLRAAQKFLRSGHKVKITVNVKGREEDYRDQAIELLQRFLDDIGELGIQETENLMERNVYMVLSPSKVAAASRKPNEPPKKKGKLREKNLSAGI